jgi:hypothetical protein
MRNRDTIEFLGLWEQLNNPDFKPVEFDGFRTQAGSNAFTMSPNGLRRPGPSGSFQKRGAMVEHLHKRISHLNLPRGSRLNSSCIPQSERLLRLNASAKQMMQSLTNDHRIEAFKEYGTLPHESE